MTKRNAIPNNDEKNITAKEQIKMNIEVECHNFTNERTKFTSYMYFNSETRKYHTSKGK